MRDQERWTGGRAGWCGVDRKERREVRKEKKGKETG